MSNSIDSLISLISLICSNSNCYKRSTYGYAETGIYNYCFKHKFPGMTKISVLNKCIIDDCENKAVYGKTYSTHCIRHKIQNLKKPAKYCKNDNCDRYASYGHEGSSKREYCIDHKSDIMVSMNRKKCKFQDCEKTAVYGYNTIDHCKDHKNNDMNTFRLICKNSNCNKTASFGYSITKQREYCYDHKRENMINVVKNTCEYDECKNNASFGYRDINKKQFCNEHRKEKMFNLDRMKCKNNQCQRYASFGIKKRQFCIEHKTENMVLINKKFCIIDGCNISPSYGEVGTKTRKYCSKHKETKMIRLH